MPLKLTMFMGQDKYSWSETHYAPNNSSFGSLNLAALALIELRAQCLGTMPTFWEARMSEVPANRVVEDVNISGGGISGVWPADPTNLVYDSERAYSPC